MHFLTLASVAFTAAAGVSAIVIPKAHMHHARDDQPSTYYTPYLEPYETYHARYLAIDCEAKHNTTYFDRCCHPMLSSETLEKNRDADCNPANLASSTAASSSATPTTSQVLSSTSGDDSDDDSDCDDSDDDDEPSSTAAPTSTHVATTSTHSSATPTTTHTTSEVTTSTHTTSTHTTSSTHTTKAATTKTSSSASSASTSSADGPFTGGVATFFYQGGQAGACGTVHADSAFIAALQTERYGDLGAKSANCGRQIKLTNTNNGKSVTVTVADACPTCKNSNSIDLSVGAFTQIATEEEGEVPISWSFIS